MDRSNRNNVFGIGVIAALIAVVLNFYLSPPAGVGSAPEPVVTGQTK